MSRLRFWLAFFFLKYSGVVSSSDAIVGGTSVLHFWSSRLQTSLSLLRAALSGATTLKAVLFARGTVLAFLFATRGVTATLPLRPRILFLSFGSILGSSFAGTMKLRLCLLGLIITFVGLPVLVLAVSCPDLRSFLRSDRSMAASEGSFR